MADVHLEYVAERWMRKLQVTQGKIVHCLVILNITFHLYNFWWFLIIQRWAGSKLIIWIICVYIYIYIYIYIHIYIIVVLSLSTVQFIVTPWTAARQAPLSMGFPRQEYLSGLPFPSPIHTEKHIIYIYITYIYYI